MQRITWLVVSVILVWSTTATAIEIPGLLQDAKIPFARVLVAPVGETEVKNQVVTNLPGVFGAGGNLAEIIGADRFYDAGFVGQGSAVANVEGGHIWNGHETLNHVTTFSHRSTAFNIPATAGQVEDLYDKHATWVGEIIGGRTTAAAVGAAPPSSGPWQSGIAYGTDLRSGAIAKAWTGSAYSLNFNIDAGTYDNPYRQFFEGDGTNGPGRAVDVINSSWGGVDATGTNYYARKTDAHAYENPATVFVMSAGNSGPSNNTVGFPGSGFNGITVGALQNNGSNGYLSVANFSSRGPQDFSGGGVSCNACRAVVDIAAPGTNLTSALFAGTAGGNNTTLPSSSGTASATAYTTSLAGTSFAAPTTAGSAALLYSASYNTPSLSTNLESRDARVIKAVLLNSADKISGWDNGQVLNGSVIETTQSLDWATGAGALNLDVAFDQFINSTHGVLGTPSGSQGSVGVRGWDLGVVESGSDNVYTINEPLLGGSIFTVTLNWFRNRTEDETTLSAFDNAQADLDLIIRNTSTNSIVARSISNVNVVEHLNFAIPTTGQYQVEVRLDGFVFDATPGLTTESYGLAWRGVTAVPEPSAFLFLGIVAFGSYLGRGYFGAKDSTAA